MSSTHQKVPVRVCFSLIGFEFFSTSRDTLYFSAAKALPATESLLRDRQTFCRTEREGAENRIPFRRQPAVESDSTQATICAPTFEIDITCVPVNMKFAGLIFEVDGVDSTVTFALLRAANYRCCNESREFNGHVISTTARCACSTAAGNQADAAASQLAMLILPNGWRACTCGYRSSLWSL